MSALLRFATRCVGDLSVGASIDGTVVRVWRGGGTELVVRGLREAQALLDTATAHDGGIVRFPERTPLSVADAVRALLLCMPVYGFGGVEMVHGQGYSTQQISIPVELVADIRRFRLVATGRVDLGRPVARVRPRAGTAYTVSDLRRDICEDSNLRLAAPFDEVDGIIGRTPFDFEAALYVEMAPHGAVFECALECTSTARTPPLGVAAASAAKASLPGSVVLADGSLEWETVRTRHSSAQALHTLGANGLLVPSPEPPVLQLRCTWNGTATFGGMREEARSTIEDLCEAIPSS